MAKKYRVAVIGRTGKGNYGHGLDTVWQARRQRRDRRRRRREREGPRRRRASGSGPRTPTPTTARCSRRRSRRSSASPTASSTSTATWCSPAPRPGPASSSKSRCAARSPRPTRWSPPARSTTSSWPSPTRRATARALQRDQGADRRRPARRRARAARPRQGRRPRRRPGPDGARHAHLRPDALPRRRRPLVLRPRLAGTASRPTPRPTSARAARAWARSPATTSHAIYGFDKGVVGYFGTHKAKAGGERDRFGLTIYGTQGRRPARPPAACRRPTSCDDPSLVPRHEQGRLAGDHQRRRRQAGDR